MTTDASTPTHEPHPGEIHRSRAGTGNARVAAIGTRDPVTPETARHPVGRLAVVGKHRRDVEPVLIELEPGQNRKVARDASGAGTLSVLLSGLEGSRATVEAAAEHLKDASLSHSLIWGLMMFAALPADGSYASNASLARALGMNQSTALRYMATLVAAGFAERNPATAQIAPKATDRPA